MANEVAQMLVQGVLAFDQNQSILEHTTFVLSINKTVLQLSRAVISRSYMTELCQDKPLTESFQIVHSEVYDLREPDRRREALRLIIALFRLSSFNYH